MRIELHIHHHDSECRESRAQVLQQLCVINHQLEAIVTTQAEQAAMLRNVAQTQEKTFQEIQELQGTVTTLNDRVAELESIIRAQGEDASAELVEAVAAVVAAAKKVDDAIPDVAQPENPETPSV